MHLSNYHARLYEDYKTILKNEENKITENKEQLVDEAVERKRDTLQMKYAFLEIRQVAALLEELKSTNKTAYHSLKLDEAHDKLAPMRPESYFETLENIRNSEFSRREQHAKTGARGLLEEANRQVRRYREFMQESPNDYLGTLASVNEQLAAMSLPESDDPHKLLEFAKIHALAASDMIGKIVDKAKAANTPVMGLAS